MGVHGLWSILDSTGHPIKLEALEGRVLGVDATIWLYQFLKGFRDRDDAAKLDGHKLGLFRRISKLLFYKIKPVFVFDGPAPLLKRRTLERRQERRNKSLVKAQGTALKILAGQIKAQYPDADVEELIKNITVPNLTSHHLVATNKLGDEDLEMFKLKEKSILEQIQEEELNEGQCNDLNPVDEEWEPDWDSEQELIRDEYQGKTTYSSSKGGPSNSNVTFAHAQDLSKLDIDSEEFKNLPAEVRHEILTDIKNKNRRHKSTKILPDEANSFSSFQLERLRNKRSVQEKIEEAERDICTSISANHELDLDLLNKKRSIVESYRVHSDPTLRMLYLKKLSDQSTSIKHDITLESGKGTAKLDNLNASQQSEKEEKVDLTPIKASLKEYLSSAEKPDFKLIGKNLAKTTMKLQPKISLSPKISDDDSDTNDSLVPLQEPPTQEVTNNDDEVIQILSEDDTETILKTPDKSKPIEDDKSPESYGKTKNFDYIFEDQYNQKEENVSLTPIKAALREYISSAQKPDKPTSTGLATLNLQAKFTMSPKMSDDSDSNQSFVPVEESPLQKAMVDDEEKADLTILISSDEATDEDNWKVTESLKSCGKTTMFDNRNDEYAQLDKRGEKLDLTIYISSDDEADKDAPPTAGLRVRETSPQATESSQQEPRRQLTLEVMEELKRKANRGERRLDDAHVSDSQTSIPLAASCDENSNQPSTSSQANVSSQPPKQMNTEELEALKRKVNREERHANSMTDKIIRESKELLELWGIPYIVAAGEAEAQCATLETLKLTEGTITDDSDVWLFGARVVYKNFFSDHKYAMQFKMTDIEHHIRLDRESLICIAMLVGSDYTDGIDMVGPVTALEILSEFSGKNLSPLIEFKNWWTNYKASKDKIPGNKKRKSFTKLNLPEEFPSRIVFDGYMQPCADDSDERFTWGMPKLDELREYARQNFGWDTKKIDDCLLPVMKKVNDKTAQTKIDMFFFRTEANKNPSLFRSKRVNKALESFSGNAFQQSTKAETNKKRKKDIDGEKTGTTTRGGRRGGRGKTQAKKRGAFSRVI